MNFYCPVCGVAYPNAGDCSGVDIVHETVALLKLSAAQQRQAGNVTEPVDAGPPVVQQLNPGGFS